MFQRIDLTKVGPPIKIYRYKGPVDLIKAKPKEKDGKTKVKRGRKGYL